MQKYFFGLILILACSVWTVLPGCAPVGTDVDDSSEINESDVDVTEPEPVEDGQSPVIEWQSDDPAGTPDTSAPPLDGDMGLVSDVNLEADPEVIDLALEYIGKLGFDTSKLVVFEQKEIIHSDELWLWMLSFDGENGPVATTYVRQDFMRVESFNCYPELAPQAVEPGGELPNLTIEALGFSDLGYRHVPWTSIPGLAAYRKHVPIGEWDVCVGEVFVAFVPETGTLVGVEWLENPPVEEFTMEVDQEAAIAIVAEDLNNPDMRPAQVDLVQIQDGPSRLTDMNVYWELTYELGSLFVNCNDGTIALKN